MLRASSIRVRATAFVLGSSPPLRVPSRHGRFALRVFL